MKSEEVLRYERKQPRGILEKRLAIVGGLHQTLNRHVMLEVNLRMPDNRLVVRYSTKDNKGKRAFYVTESDAEILFKTAENRKTAPAVSSWNKNSKLTFGAEHQNKRYKINLYGDPISRSLNKNNAFIDIDGVGSFTYVDIDNVIGLGTIAIVAIVAIFIIVMTCIVAPGALDTTCEVTIKKWGDPITGDAEVTVKSSRVDSSEDDVDM